MAPTGGIATSGHGGALVATDDPGRGVGPRGMVSLLACVGAQPRHEIYFSTPITTGEMFVRWRRATRAHLSDDHPDYAFLHRENVIAKNLERVRPIVTGLRQRYPDRLVIDPTSLEDVDGWVQADYRDFWCSVVAEYATMIIFAKGWQFSHGCVAEFATAAEFNVPAFSEDMADLQPHQGIRLITEAVAELERLGEEPQVLRDSLEKASRFVFGEGASG